MQKTNRTLNTCSSIILWRHQKCCFVIWMNEPINHSALKKTRLAFQEFVFIDHSTVVFLPLDSFFISIAVCTVLLYYLAYAIGPRKQPTLPSRHFTDIGEKRKMQGKSFYIQYGHQRSWSAGTGAKMFRRAETTKKKKRQMEERRRWEKKKEKKAEVKAANVSQHTYYHASLYELTQTHGI